MGMEDGSAGQRRGAASLARKRPHQRRARTTVEAILEAAAHILDTRGAEAFNTNAVAERAGVSIGSLYQYFSNKTALVQALIQREHAQLLGELVALGERCEGMALLDALIALAVEHQLRRPALNRLLDAEEAHLPPAAETWQLQLALTAIWNRSLGADLIAREPRLPQDLFAMIQGMVDVAGQFGETDAAALAERIRRAVFAYLATVAPGAGGVSGVSGR